MTLIPTEVFVTHDPESRKVTVRWPAQRWWQRDRVAVLSELAFSQMVLAIELPSVVSRQEHRALDKKFVAECLAHDRTKDNARELRWDATRLLNLLGVGEPEVVIKCRQKPRYEAVTRAVIALAKAVKIPPGSIQVSIGP